MTEPNNFTHDEVVQIAETAATKAISNLFDKLDIDVNNKDTLIRLRRDLNFLDDQREGQEILRQNMKKGALYLAGTAALGFIYLMWDVLKIGVFTMLQNVGR